MKLSEKDLKTLLNEKDLAIHQNAVRVSQKYLRCESELIQVIQDVDQNKIFYKLRYSSLFDYAQRELKLSPDVALNFIAVARKAIQVPELKLAIDEGSLTVSKARKITPVLTSTNKTHWLELAKTSTQKTIEKEVARVMPQSAVKEQAKYISDERLKVTLGLSEKNFKMLKRSQDIESKKARRPLTLEETLEKLLEAHHEKNEPVMRAQRIESQRSKDQKNKDEKEQAERIETKVQKTEDQRTEGQRNKDVADNANNATAPNVCLKTYSDQIPLIRQKNPTPQTSKCTLMAKQALESRHPIAFPKQFPFIRTSTPAQQKRQVILRDKDSCQHQYPDGSRCLNQRFTQIHHKIPISHGGQNGLQNLITLCSGHHKAMH
jgi:hypothetical protein